MISVFMFIRFILIALIMYIGLTIIRNILRAFQTPSRRTPHFPQSEKPSQPQEVYKDVQDAKFVELPGKDKEEKDK